MIFFGIFSVGVKGIVYLLFRKSDPKVKEMTVRYLQTIKWALPCLAIDVGVTACLRGVKNAKLPFAFTLIVNLINIVLCVLFIFKMNFGYIGGAYAYNISIMAGSIAKLLVVILPITDIHINHLYKMDMGIIKQIIKIGFPTLFEQFWVKTGFLGMQTITALLGTFTLAGYQISSNVFNILYAITAGLETTMITFVSGYNASGEPQKSEKTTFGIVKYAEIIMLLLGIIVFAFAPNISAFFSNDSAVISSAVKIIRIMCITLPFTTYFQSIQGVLKICPDVKVVIIMNILNTWFLRVPISYVFVKYCGLDFYGLFIGFLVDYITRSIGFGVEAKKKRWLYRSIK